MGKRFFFFILMNILVVASITIITSILGVRNWVTAQGLNYESLIIFCLIWGMVGSFISLAMSKFMAKSMMGVQIVDQDPNFSHLVRKVHYLSQKAGLSKMPEVGIFQSPEINAFATGPSKNNSLVAVSTGLLHGMSDDEVEGVLGHEVAHIANGDMVTMALVQGVINAFVMFFARVAAFAVNQAMRSDDDEDSGFTGGWSYFLTVIAFEFLFGFLGMFVVSYFSRYREYRADEGGAKLAGKSKMRSALVSLQRNFEVLSTANQSDDKAIACMKISTKSSFMELLSTHPSLDKRIKALDDIRAF